MPITRHFLKLPFFYRFYPLLLAIPVLILNLRGLSQNFMADDWYLLWDQADNAYHGQLFWLGWGYVRPIGVLTWKFCYALFGLNPSPYYVVALLLQLFNTWLVYSIVKKWLKSPLSGLVAGFIFSTYYLGWEPALWLSSCFFDVQSAFFMLVAFRLLQNLGQAAKSNQADEKKEKNFWWLIAGVIFCYFLATFSKETGLLLLPIVLCYDWWQGFLQRRGWKRNLIFYSALVLVAISFFVAHYWPGTKVTTGDIVHPDQLPANLLYHLEGLFLLPIYPYTYTGFNLIIAELKMASWLLPALFIFGYLLWQAWRNNWKFSGRNLAKSAEARLLLFGLVWAACCIVATISLNYHTLRFLYAAHIGATFFFTALTLLLVRFIATLPLPKIARRVGYAGLIYLLAVLSIAGMLSFGQDSEIYVRSSDFTRQLVTLVQQEQKAGATSFVLVNLPKSIDLPQSDQPNIFYDELNPQLILLLDAGLPITQVKVVRTADLPQLGYDAVGDKITASQLPPATIQQAVVTVVRVGAGEYQLIGKVK